MNPLTGSLGVRFFAPRATCAVCGREVDADGAAVVVTADPHVEASTDGLQLLAEVTPGESLVVCKDCATE
jgi:hypothetical protein